MRQSTQQTNLAALKATICATSTMTPVEPWFYPTAPPVQGFCGTDPLILVGERPSYNEWLPSDPGRRRLYDSLVELGAGNAHLTDLYKYRGDVKNALALTRCPILPSISDGSRPKSPSLILSALSLWVTRSSGF